MEEFYGVYRGFTPTDESAIALGEMELTLSKEGLVVRIATGLLIHEERIPHEQFVPMTADEVSTEYNPGSIYPSRTVGFREKESGIPKLLFLTSLAEDEFGLVVKLGEMSEIMGPTLLYSPAQIAEGKFQNFLAEMKDDAGKNVFPLLTNDGKA